MTDRTGSVGVDPNEEEVRASEEIAATEDPLKAGGKFDWFIWPAVGILASLAFVAPFVMLAGADVVEGYRVLFDGAIGTSFGLGTTLRMAAPLTLVGLGVAIPYRAGLFNIGGEGQLLMGALMAVVVGTQFGAAAGVPGAFVLALVAGAIGGGIWGSLAGYLKAWRGINEIISTILLNFLALYIVQYLVVSPFKDPELTYAASPRILPSFELPTFGGTARIHLGYLLGIALAILMAWYVETTRAGFRLRLVGINSSLAARQGISIRGQQLIALTLGGALAGLGGTVDALGNQFRIGQEFSPGWGFDAIAIALLARGNMLAVVPVAFFFGALRNGSSVLGRTLDVPGAIVFILQAIPIIVVAIFIGFRASRRHARG
jgi:ABC-type uncharacterized transport system permease subunit